MTAPVLWTDHESVALKLRVDGREQRGEFAGVDESVAKATKRALGGHSIGQANAAKVHEVDTHVECRFELRVRQAVPLT